MIVRRRRVRVEIESRTLRMEVASEMGEPQQPQRLPEVDSAPGPVAAPAMETDIPLPLKLSAPKGTHHVP